MKDDRCCGSGTCIINAEGECWCGQKWDGEKMCQPYFVNESGVKINSVTGKPIQDHPTDQIRQEKWLRKSEQVR